MVSVPRIPSFKSPSFNCPRCGALAAQDWFDIYAKPSEGDGPLEEMVDDETTAWVLPEPHWPVWTASRCYSCRDNSIWLDNALVYPDPFKESIEAVSEPHDDMPGDAAVLFREAVSVLPFSRRAAAALCRASMERLVKFLDPDCPKNTRLDERLVRLEDRVSSSTINLLNVLRHVGNTALHGGHDGDGTATIYIDEDDRTIAETFFVAINTLVDELVTRPRRSQELYDSLPESVRAAYERKAGRPGGGNPLDVGPAHRSS